MLSKLLWTLADLLVGFSLGLAFICYLDKPPVAPSPNLKNVLMVGKVTGTVQIIGKPKPVDLQFEVTLTPEMNDPCPTKAN